MKKSVNVYFDMDGVLAEYGVGDSVKKMMCPGYFIARKEIKLMVEVLKRLAVEDELNVRILTAVFPEKHNRTEKLAWLKALFLGGIEVCFVPVGADKAEYADKDAMNILVDDYTKNLLRWEKSGENFMGIKFYNSINGNHGEWLSFNGRFVSYTMSVDEIVGRINQAAGMNSGRVCA